MPSPATQQQQAWPASSSSNNQNAPDGRRQRQQKTHGSIESASGGPKGGSSSGNGRRSYQSVKYPSARSVAKTSGSGRGGQKETQAYVLGNWMPGTNKKPKTPARKGLVRRKGEKNSANWGVYDRNKGQPYEVDLPPLGYKRGQEQDEREKERWGSKKDAGGCGLM